jgi:glycosyltransferase involved in cell wall biosynthesis
MQIEMTIPKLEPSEEGIYAGGSLNSFFSLCKGLKSSNVGVEIITTIPSRKIAIFKKNKPVDISYNIFSNNARPQSILFSLIYLLKTICWAKRKIRRKADLVHGHSGYASYAWVTYFLGLITRCPIVHTVYCPINHQKKQGRLLNFLSGASFSRYPLNKMESIVAMSQNVCDSLLKAGVSRSKIFVIPNGIDTERYRPNSNVQVKIREILGIDNDAKIILFVGNLLASKGFDVLLEAMAYVVTKEAKTRLVVTLELEHHGFKNRWEEYKARANTLGLDRYIQRLGIIDFMPELMAASDIVVAPYRNTIGPSDYPLALMESMSTGTCVVGTRVGGIPELIEDGVTGRLVKSDDVHGLSEVLNELLATPEVCKQMGKNARQRVKNLYSIDKIAGRYLNLYKKIIKKAI